jgi:hypothetical protein
MPFVKFEAPPMGNQSKEPMASIGKGGYIRINRAAMEELGLQGLEYVTLHWDDDTECIGLLPCSDDECGAYRIGANDRNGSYRVNGLRFLRHFDIDIVYIGMQVKPYLEDKMIVIPLGKKPGKEQK